jgi:hypothetical protein
VAIAAALGLAACGAPPQPPATAEAQVEVVKPGGLASAEAAGTTAGGTPEASASPMPAPLPPVELVQVEPSSPPPRMPSLAIVAPTKGQLVSAAKAALTPVRLRATGWTLASGGNHLCVALDRQPCRRVTDLAAPLALGDLGPPLEDGQHVLTVIARRGSGESVKPAGKSAAFASASFFVGKRTPPVWKDGAPIVIVSVPDDGPAPEAPLVDVYVANADFGAGSYRLHTSISGPGIESGKGESVADLKPWRLQGPRPGKYLVRFSLFKYQPASMKSEAAVEVTLESRAVSGPFSEVARSFRVTK